MKMKIIILLLSLCLLTGCTPKSSQASFPLITKITVHYENQSIRGALHYTEDHKMQKILSYLRLLKPYGQPAENPDTVQGTLFQIILTHSGGDTTVYQQKADRYLKSGEDPWLCISPQKALELSLLLGYLEEDSPNHQTALSRSDVGMDNCQFAVNN